MTLFHRIQLRTTDIPAATAFYASVLGPSAHDIVPLPAQAAARGAPPHWLGHIEVGDVPRAVEAFVALGATRLGPEGEAVVVRDPGGAVVALEGPRGEPRSDVVWYVLNTHDVHRAVSTYQSMFGWAVKDAMDLGEHGVHHPFSWGEGDPVGTMADIAGRSGVHPHWLFHFGVIDIHASIAAVRAGGGRALGPFPLPGGALTAVCEDAQGAAFGLFGPG